MELPPISQDNLHKIVLKTLERKCIEKQGDKFSLVPENIESFLGSHKINTFIEYIKRNLEKLLSRIKEKYPVFNDYVKTIKKNSSVIVLEYNMFKKLIDEFCYQYDKDEDKFELQKKLELFYEIFLLQNSDTNFLPFVYFEFESEVPKSSLYFYLLLKIFQTQLQTSESVDLIFIKLFTEWICAIKKNEAIGTFLIPIPNISILEDIISKDDTIFKINEEISIYRFISYKFVKKRGSDFSFSMSTYNYLEYKTKISFNLFVSVEERNNNLKRTTEKYLDERKLINKNIQEIVCLFYLNGIEFKYDGFILNLPWWFSPKFQEYYKLGEVEMRPIQILEKNLKNITYFYPKIIETQLFSSDNFTILCHHYLQLFNRRFAGDVILDAFIILESIFTRGSTAEVTFRLSFNIAFFLAKDTYEFKEIYDFFNEVYGLRSVIVHGEKWDKKLKRLIGNDKEYKSHLEVFKKLKFYINKCLEKLILTMEQDPNAFDKLNGTYFVLNSNIVKK